MKKLTSIIMMIIGTVYEFMKNKDLDDTYIRKIGIFIQYSIVIFIKLFTVNY